MTNIETRLKAFARDCVKHGDMTPAAERMLERLAQELTEPVNRSGATSSGCFFCGRDPKVLMHPLANPNKTLHACHFHVVKSISRLAEILGHGQGTVVVKTL